MRIFFVQKNADRQNDQITTRSYRFYIWKDCTVRLIVLTLHGLKIFYHHFEFIFDEQILPKFPFQSG